MKIYKKTSELLIRVSFNGQSIMFCETTLLECASACYQKLINYTDFTDGNGITVSFREFKEGSNGKYKSFAVYGLTEQQIMEELCSIG
jgi:hypothetical protein